MAETFKRAGGDVAAAGTVSYTAPTSSGAVAIILSISLANKTTSIVTATAEIVESDGTTVGSTLIKDADIPSETGLEIVQNKVVLEAGEQIKLTTNSDNNLSATIAVLEIT